MALAMIFWLLGALLVGLALPLLRRKVGPNHLYGLRVGETLASEEVWYEANARSARDLVAVGVGTILGSTLLFALPWSNPDHCVLVCCLLLIAAVIWYCARGIRIAREVARELGDLHRQDGNHPEGDAQ